MIKNPDSEREAEYEVYIADTMKVVADGFKTPEAASEYVRKLHVDQGFPKVEAKIRYVAHLITYCRCCGRRQTPAESRYCIQQWLWHGRGERPDFLCYNCQKHPNDAAAKVIKEIKMEKKTGAPDKRTIVETYQRENPSCTQYRCAKDTGLSINTVKKWWQKELQQKSKKETLPGQMSIEDYM